jgi:hypothetical protein
LDLAWRQGSTAYAATRSMVMKATAAERVHIIPNLSFEK